MGVDLSAVEEFVDAIREPEQGSIRTYNATVSRTDTEGVVWVNLAGSEKETPTASTSTEVKRGDSVSVEWRNNKLYIVGNSSNPSAGVIRVQAVEQATQIASEAAASAVRYSGEARMAAEDAKQTADSVHGIAVQAQEDAAAATTAAGNAGRAASTAQAAAEAAQATADSKKRVFTSQPVPPYSVGDLWIDASGGYQNGDSIEYGSDAYSPLVGTGQVGYMVVASDTQESFVYVCTFARTSSESYNSGDWQLAATDDGAVDELREWFWHDANGAHVLGDATGFRNDITSTGMNIVDTSTETSVAEFGSSGARIGKAGGAHSVIDTDGQRFYASDGSTSLANIGYGEIYDGSGQTSMYPYYTFGTRRQQTTSFLCSDNVSVQLTGIGDKSMCVGKNNLATRGSSYSEGEDNGSTGISHAEGYNCLANGDPSHAEGYKCAARNDNVPNVSGQTYKQPAGSHAEGYQTVSKGQGSHSEGYSTVAYQTGSHAEGYQTEAKKAASHAQNTGTIADSESQTVLGKYNTVDSNNTYAVIVGNGSSNSNRSNALTVDWSGNVATSGKVTGTNTVSEEGTSGDWKYRKWSSGIAEAWGKLTASSATFTATGSVYYRSLTSQSFPSGLFNAAPMVTATCEMSNVGGTTVQSVTSSTFTVNVLSAVSTARALTIYVHAVGTWQ